MKYKIVNGKNKFIFNLYHTRCSCLIKGKDEDYFIDIDFRQRRLADFIEFVKHTLHNTYKVAKSTKRTLEVAFRFQSQHYIYGHFSIRLFCLQTQCMTQNYTCSTSKSDKDLSGDDILKTKEGL